ncbi:hypothetical protein NBRC116601_14160 [Cognatishimia sp. WU-CL00825]|uniref:YciI family protein n=1 Tax=Cognatishimia sp. WU-CL00825 TaxID=3127658 RepID=UPI0031078EB5
MKYVVLFEDNPETDLCTRLSYLPLHLAYLEKNADRISAVGGLTDADDIGRGDLWVLTAEDEDEVARYVREDPFWPTGLRKSFQIMKWRQVFANGARIAQAEPAFA